MKIIDYSQQNSSVSLPLTNSKNLIEIATATLLFIVPIITLFLLAQ